MATVLEPSLARGPAPESSDRSFGVRLCGDVCHHRVFAAASPGLAALVGFWHRRCLRAAGHYPAQPSASSEPGMARARASAAPGRKPARDGRGFLPLRHADRVDRAAARQGCAVACVPPRFVELLDRAGAIAAATCSNETAILNRY